MLKIKEAKIEDYEDVYNVIKTAFKTAQHSDGNEHELVKSLRTSDSFIPKLSLVAIKDNKIVGYILFTKVTIGFNEEIALAPLAVLPDYQKQGIGSKLIKKAHKMAKHLGYHYSIVLGSEKYYKKFGYMPAIKYGIKPPFDVKSENFMAIKLKDTNIKIQGVVKYSKEFGL